MRDFIFGAVRRRLARAGLPLAALALFAAAGAAAQQIPGPAAGAPDEPQRKQRTGWAVGLAGGPRDDVSMRFAGEIAKAVGDGDELRVLPVISYGPAGNVEDLLYLNSVDVALTQSDVLEYFRTEHKTALGDRIQYIARLPDRELHIAARDGIRSVDDLRGRTVVFGPAKGAAAVTGTLYFRRLGIAVTPVFTDARNGMDMVTRGDADALITVEPKAGGSLLGAPRDAGLHLVPAPHSAAVAGLYAPAALSEADYPNLIGPGETIATIAVPGVLAVQNLPKTDDRFRRVLRFAQYFYARFERLAAPPFHPAWRNADLTVGVPGWTRFGPSEVFRQFLIWRDRQDSAGRTP